MSETMRSVNPGTGELVKEYRPHSEAEVSERLNSAVRAQHAWSETSLEERAGVLITLAERLEQDAARLAGVATREMGKLPREAQGEIEKCAWVCRYYAEHAAQFLAEEQLEDDAENYSFIAHEPLGVILAVMPWNFPYWQVFRCAAPALMAGNAVVLKHASNVCGCAIEIESLFPGTGAPDGLFSTLLVSGSRASELLSDVRVAGASVTGSEKAGAAVAAAAGAQIKPTVLELGGSDPFIVLDLKDRDNIVKNAITSRFMNCGQSCIAAKRFIVVDAVFDEFIAAFSAACGDLQPGENLAPMARNDLREELQKQVDDARGNGADVILGGDPAPGAGFFYPPTIVTGLSPTCRLYTEEAFGPVACVFRAMDASDAVRIANDSELGLGGSVWCQDPDVGLAVARRVQSGAVYVNRMMASDPRLPFGGIKRSGYGRELSRAGMLEFVNRKTISMVR